MIVATLKILRISCSKEKEQLVAAAHNGVYNDKRKTEEL